MSVHAVFRLPRDQLDAEGQPVAVGDGGSALASVVLDPETLAQVSTTADNVGQAIWAFAKSAPAQDQDQDQGLVPMPTVTTFPLLMTTAAVAAVVEQVRQIRQHLVYSVVVPATTAPHLVDWLRESSRPLVVGLAGLSAELEIGSVMVVARARSRALQDLDDVVVSRHLDLGPSEPVASLLDWTQWVGTAYASRPAVQKALQKVLAIVRSVLSGLAANYAVPDSSYRTGNMLEDARSQATTVQLFVLRVDRVYQAMRKH